MAFIVSLLGDFSRFVRTRTDSENYNYPVLFDNKVIKTLSSIGEHNDIGLYRDSTRDISREIVRIPRKRTLRFNHKGRNYVVKMLGLEFSL